MTIGIIEEKKAGFLMISIIFIISILLSICFESNNELKIALLVLFGISYLVCTVCCLVSMEWYVLDENSVIVKNIFGTVNQVNYKDVTRVYVRRLRVFRGDKGVSCLLFKDHRKESGIFAGDTVDNHKKYIVRIPYTQGVVDYLKHNHINIDKYGIFDTLKCK